MKQKNIFFILASLIFSILGAAHSELKAHAHKVFCTPSDERFFPYLMNLIGSIHTFHFDDTHEIAVFNLGFTIEQMSILRNIEKVAIYEVEMVHPDLLTYFHVGRGDGSPGQGRMVRGWYAWKPVVIKQALDMFDCILYLDAGTLILNPIDDLFKYIEQNGYFFVDCGHNIRWMTTEYVVNMFDLDSEKNKWILNPSTSGLSGAFQGLTRRHYNDYVLPIYNLVKDLRSFIDDGTAPHGFGTSRHDQTLFSIQASLLSLKIAVMDHTQEKPIELMIDNQKYPFYITWNSKYVKERTQVLLQTGQARHVPDFKSNIRYLNK